MNRQAEYRDEVGSPQNYSEGQWNSPPPQFQEHDHIHSTPGMSHVYSNQASPPGVSPPLPYEPEYAPNPDPKKQDVSQQGYSTEKETPYQSTIGPTPDFSAPQVVPGQFSFYPHRPISHSSPGGATPASPYIRPYGFKEHVDPLDAPENAPEPLPTKEERKCGMKRRNFVILIVIIILLIIGLALGLGLGLGLGLRNKDSKEDPANPICRKNPEWCIGGYLSADYVSKKGAFNGTGIALAGESWNKGQRKLFTLYFQHHTGDIRYMQYSTDQTWLGGTKAQTVVSDAKAASPISAVSFAIDATQYVHIFYLDKNNTVKQVVQDNITSIWQPGPLSKLNLKAFDSPSSGLQACWKGNYYGDSDYTKFPVLTGANDTKPFDNIKGMNIWFATDESTFAQYAWYSGHENDTWVSIKPWPSFNGHAGVGCYSWGDGTSSYAMLANKDNVVEFWWKDTNSSVQSTEDHPINSWVNASEASIAGVHPSTSLGFTTYFYAQMADRTIKGYNVTYASENTTLAETEAFSIADPAGPVKALGGTHLTVTSYKEQKGADTWDSLYVFFQREGDDIAAFTRPVLGGQWTGAALNIPDE